MANDSPILDFLEDLDTDVFSILDSEFEVEVTDTELVPNLNDSLLTYDDPDTQIKKAKRLATCVLYIDIRNSSQISAERRSFTLARMYSAFIRAMVLCARQGGGHVRNIVGDRVMVLFDTEACFARALFTACLCNTAAQRILKKRIKNFDFRCGIGIDYGTMLVVKAGVPRRGVETEFYRSLVWLGRPANVASKLTDLAHKVVRRSEPGVSVGTNNPFTRQLEWREEPVSAFLKQLKPTYSPSLNHTDPRFSTFFETTIYHKPFTQSAVLLTEEVLKGARQQLGTETWLTKEWRRAFPSVPGYSGKVFGGNPLIEFRP